MNDALNDKLSYEDFGGFMNNLMVEVIVTKATINSVMLCLIQKGILSEEDVIEMLKTGVGASGDFHPLDGTRSEIAEMISRKYLQLLQIWLKAVQQKD